MLDLQPRSATLVWVTKEPLASQLELSGPGGMTTQLEPGSELELRRRHRMVIPDLDPGCQDRYLIDGRF